MVVCVLVTCVERQWLSSEPVMVVCVLVTCVERQWLSSGPVSHHNADWYMLSHRYTVVCCGDCSLH